MKTNKCQHAWENISAGVWQCFECGEMTTHKPDKIAEQIYQLVDKPCPDDEKAEEEPSVPVGILVMPNTVVLGGVWGTPMQISAGINPVQCLHPVCWLPRTIDFGVN